MKTRFSTLDIIAALTELRERAVGMRVNQIYDVDHKTYLLKFARQEEKLVLLIESGIRFHCTEFEWPKNPVPSGFTMKLRKHLKNKRLECIKQVGYDRIIDMQFGTKEATYHVILELYDRGNIILTDFSLQILNVLRPRATGSEDVKFLVKEIYPIESAKWKSISPAVTSEEVMLMFKDAKPKDNLRKILNPKLNCGPAILDHVLLEAGFPLNSRFGEEFVFDDVDRLREALNQSNVLLKKAEESGGQGYIILKVSKHSLPGKEDKETEAYEDFHPFLLNQHKNSRYLEFPSFNKAVDTFFSEIEGQKIDGKMMQREKEAVKKLYNVKKDHEKRMEALQISQLSDVCKAQLIEMNLTLIDRAILVIRSAIANQISWSDIASLIKEAQATGDPAAVAIKGLRLETNQFSISLKDPYDSEAEAQVIDIDLDLSAYANARKFYDRKRYAAKKETKTIESSTKAYKNAERKTKQTLKELSVVSSIIKARKTFWFEKFHWFISSENYLVIGGRDVQQNELIVKRYMKPGDIYVHADIHGASSVVVKNHPGAGEIPPKTQNEAGTMAICYSAAWEAKVVTSAWWVYQHQVSKTAPSGEYLGTGSFMIRGKKNYLVPSQLIMGFGIIFKLDEDSLERHLNERKVDFDDNDLEWQEEATDEVLLDEEDDKEVAESEENCQKHQDIEKHEDSNNEFQEDYADFKKDEALTSQNEAVSDDEKHRDTNNDTRKDEFEENKDLMVFPDTVLEDFRMKQLSESLKKEAKGVVSGSLGPNKKDRQPEKVKEAREQSKEKATYPKRGQKFKQKKMKEKYKDQDEEERQLRMNILASAGQAKETKAKKGKKNKEISSTKKFEKTIKEVLPEKVCELGEDLTVEAGKLQTEADQTTDIKLKPAQNDTTDAPDASQKPEKQEEDEEEEQSDPTGEQLASLNTLTGCPVTEDTLLFCLPVCAPYNALQNFKYKIKMTPGTGKRGKATKTALSIFLKDKIATNRERDLLKSIKDEDIARNIPGKVKLLAPNLNKVKK